MFPNVGGSVPLGGIIVFHEGVKVTTLRGVKVSHFVLSSEVFKRSCV